MALMQRLRRTLKALHEDDAGAMSVEKILILILIALPIVIVLLLFRRTIVEWFEDKENELSPD